MPQYDVIVRKTTFAYQTVTVEAETAEAARFLAKQRIEPNRFETKESSISIKSVERIK